MGSTKFGSIIASETPGLIGFSAPVTEATAGVVAFTAANILSGLILRDPNGAGRADTLPTASAILAALNDQFRQTKAVVGTSFEFTIRNTADAAETITVSTATGLTLSGTMTIAQSNSKRFLAVVTGVSTPAVTVYSLGTVVH